MGGWTNGRPDEWNDGRADREREREREKKKKEIKKRERERGRILREECRGRAGLVQNIALIPLLLFAIISSFNTSL